MCGIAGFIDTDFNNLEINKIINCMTKAISHRGPDDEDNWVDQNLGLAFCHTRLSIIDLSTNGKQPMHSYSNRFVIVFNGEIYNYKSLKKLLIDKGVLFKTNTDTEVLLNLFEFYDTKTVLNLIDGMFSFALLDKKSKILILAKDRFGEKPLYYSNFGNNKNNFIFASDLNSIIAYPKFQKKINNVAASLMLRYSYIPSPLSIYENVFKLRAGHFLSLDLSRKKYNYEEIIWLSENEDNNLEFKNDKYVTEQLESQLINSIELQKNADVNLGVFLSGGIDSSLVASIMQNSSKEKIETFNVAMEDGKNESNYAKIVAQKLGTSHNQININPKEAIKIIPELSHIYSEPFADSSQIPTALISQKTKQKVTVALTGDGADELFGGYNRYKYVPKIINYKKFVPKFISSFILSYLNKNLSVKSKNISKFYNILNPYKIIKNIDDEKIEKIVNIYSKNNIKEMYLRLLSVDDNFSNFQFIDDNIFKYSSNLWNKDFTSFDNMMLIDQSTYLQDDILVKVDRASMYHGLETRAPFLSQGVSNFAKTLPNNYKIRNGKTKWILRKILSKYINLNEIDHPKTGFSIPLNNWLRNDLKKWTEHCLSKENINKFGFLKYENVEQIRQEHLQEKNNSYTKLWNILMFQNWLEKYL